MNYRSYPEAKAGIYSRVFRNCKYDFLGLVQEHVAAFGHKMYVCAEYKLGRSRLVNDIRHHHRIQIGF